MSKEIKCDRRRLLGIAALMFAAGQLGMIGAAQAQSGKQNRHISLRSRDSR